MRDHGLTRYFFLRVHPPPSPPSPPRLPPLLLFLLTLNSKIPLHHKVNYCRLWEALVSGNVPMIQKACLDLGVGADVAEDVSIKQMECFVMSITQRPWSFDEGGYLSVESFALLTIEERRQLRDKYRDTFNDIIPTLEKMPRFLLLTSRLSFFFNFVDK
jgi:hypothetical protein